MEKILVLDFGGQYAHLIASRLRSLGFFAEISLPQNFSLAIAKQRVIKGIILSGGPASVLAADAPQLPLEIFACGKPILAICYGFQLAIKILGGKIKRGQVAEFGPTQLTQITPKKSAKIFHKLPQKFQVWMSHFDVVQSLPCTWQVLARTPHCQFAAAETTNLWGVQFHPEVAHTEFGTKILAKFAKCCGLAKNWSLKEFLQSEIQRIKKQVGSKKVFLLTSGGVDSTVALALLQQALGPQKVFGLLIDTGLLRAGEAQAVLENFRKHGFQHLQLEKAARHFLAALKNVSEPEAKRRIIGRVFVQVQRKVLRRLKFNTREWLLGQGTIYPDTIESAGTKHADLIKTHHNRVPEIAKMLAQNLVVEPLKELYKDEVRAIGRQLKLAPKLLQREPFPGPGLGIRILCGETKPLAKGKSLAATIQRKWQTKARVLPLRSVGIQGDQRTFHYPVALFAPHFNLAKFVKLATSILNHFVELNRVLLCLTASTPPRRFLTQKVFLTRDRIALCQRVDEQARQILACSKVASKVWQMPVILAPISTTGDKESVILRPVESEEAMTAAAALFEPQILRQFAQGLTEFPEIEQVFLDLTNKPPGTIEWE